MKLSLNNVLTIIIAVLLVFILSGTAVGLTKKSALKKQMKPETQHLNSTTPLKSLNSPDAEAPDAYYNLGTIRVITAPAASQDDSTGTAMVLTPWLSYPQGDTVFYEEIARKQLVLKGIISTYFSSRTKQELLSLSEEKILSELKASINKTVSLGQITDIYFTDYLFLE